MSDVIEDMTVNITVTVSGTYDLTSNPPPTISASYTGTTTPAANGNQSVILANGNINLNALNKAGGDYSNETNISFTLAGSINDTQGNTYTPEFSADAGNNIRVVPVGTNPPGNPIPAGWSRSANGSSTVGLTDPDIDGQNYNYTLFAIFGNVTCPIDPAIMNRGPN